MLITTDLIMTTGAVISVIVAFFTFLYKFFGWIQEQGKQSKEIQSLKTEQRIILKGVLACLDGLQQQGCNHTVPQARQELEDYLNDKAHS